MLVSANLEGVWRNVNCRCLFGQGMPHFMRGGDQDLIKCIRELEILRKVH